MVETIDVMAKETKRKKVTVRADEERRVEDGLAAALAANLVEVADRGSDVADPGDVGMVHETAIAKNVYNDTSIATLTENIDGDIGMEDGHAEDGLAAALDANLIEVADPGSEVADPGYVGMVYETAVAKNVYNDTGVAALTENFDIDIGIGDS